MYVFIIGQELFRNILMKFYLNKCYIGFFPDKNALKESTEQIQKI